MNPALPHWNRERWLAATAAGAIQFALLWALVAGLAIHVPRIVDDGLKVFGIAVEPPPKPVVPVIPARQRIKRPEGAASPANLRSRATEVTAPEPVVPLVVPPPIVVAPKAATGSDASSGASNVPGPGTGSGGIGDGTGSGGSGDGDGGGWEDETPPRWLKGRLDDRDYPGELGDTGIGGAVGVRYSVLVDGRVGNCRVTRSSGNALLDRTTCALIEKRFRYDPSRDARGRPVQADIVETHSWFSEIDPNEPEVREREVPVDRRRLKARDLLLGPLGRRRNR